MLSLLVGLLYALSPLNILHQDGIDLPISPPLSTVGNQIVDSNNHTVHLHCVAWSGFHMEDYLAFGLEFQPVQRIINLIKLGGFNCVRFEFSAEMVLKNPKVDSELLKPNPEYIGMSAIEIYQDIVKLLTDQQVMVILDYHMMDAGWCCDPLDENGLWYNKRWSESSVLEQLKVMVELNKNNPFVIGVDVRNEIRPVIKFYTVLGKRILDPINTHHPTWGTGLKSDWAQASERFGNELLKINPDLLIIIQGMFVLDSDHIKLILEGTKPKDLKFPQQLKGVKNRPIELIYPNKLVYSSHDYSWHYLFNRPWKDVTYEEWKEEAESNWGFITKDHPLFLGEFGTTHYERALNRPYWKYLLRYMKELKVHWAYWAIEGIQQRATGEENIFGLLNMNYTDYVCPKLLHQLQQLMF
ncbi:hypothetical protein HK103_005808 [Boothiomyces macroporosus]|uniref:Glycoside hydrolase family 5 domain-containing protein n=1 Tax=Boothiomyces macroporosus TaxID=261099 RepID=A0AAD5UEP8_9FUNG|nr:hypothetical protein HK103_005808 [Boothiomyces macroporosus]